MAITFVASLVTASCGGSEGDAAEDVPAVSGAQPTTIVSPETMPSTTSAPTSATSAPPPIDSTTSTAATTTEAPQPTAPSTAIADVVGSITVTPPDGLDGVGVVEWLSEQLPVRTLALADDSLAGTVYTVMESDVVTLQTGDALVRSVDGRHLTLYSGQPTEPRTRFLTFDGTEVCAVDAIGERIVATGPEVIVEASVQSTSTRQRLVYPHPYDIACSTGEMYEIVPQLVSAPDFWQESHRLTRVGDREFLSKRIPNSAPTTNEQGIRIDGRDQSSRHEFTDDGSVLVHVTTTLLEPEVRRVQARDSTTGELLWEVVSDGEVGQIAATQTSIVFGATDAAGFDGIIVVDLDTGEPVAALPTTKRLIGAS